MKKTSYKGKSREDLIKALNDKREELRSFAFGMAGAKTRNVNAGSQARKEVARILTELNAQK